MITDGKRFSDGAGFTLVELSVVIGIFLLMTVILAPFVQMAKDRARKVNCANNLRRISLALHMYAADNKDSFPPNLAALYPNYIEDEKVFDCPASKKRGTPDNPDYKYTTGLTESSPPKEIIVQDMANDHRGAVGNVLRVSGALGWSGKRP